MKKLYFLLFPLISLGQTQIGSDINGEAAGDLSGASVSMSSDGTTVAIGAPENDGFGSGTGHVRVYRNVSGVWTQIGADIDGQILGGKSGSSVSLSSNGNVIAIGSPYAGSTYKGLICVFQYVSGVWTQVGSVIHGQNNYDGFGTSISLSSDGSVVAVGAPYNTSLSGGLNTGDVRVFRNISGVWTQVGSDIEGEASDDFSGIAVSMSSDGNTVAIGALGNDGNGLSSGHVRVYRNVSDSWVQIGSDIDGEAANDNYGKVVSLSSDGNTLAVSSYGKVRVFRNVSGVWTQISGGILGLTTFVDISSHSLSSDGNILAIGARGENSNGYESGQVRIFRYVSGVWNQVGSGINGEASYDKSGTSVSLSSDGTKLAIGAPENNGNGSDSGHVRVYNLLTVLSSDDFVLSNFSVYPNPTSDLITISLKNSLQLEKVNIYNTLGQLVKSENKETINVNDLESGSYYFEIITNQGKATKTVIVK